MSSNMKIHEWADSIAFNAEGLVPVIAQHYQTNEVLMMAWMNRESFIKTMQTGEMTYWSRSRKALWRKGETSGHTQTLKEMRLDCDADTLLARVEQVGNACHTGNPHCFFTPLKEGKE
jgi:phosphoribosyl-AMP cyclohydrolase